jgi:hypothetical protein
VLCEVIGEPINRLPQLIGEPIKLTGKRALRKALAPSQGTNLIKAIIDLVTHQILGDT